MAKIKKFDNSGSTSKKEAKRLKELDKMEKAIRKARDRKGQAEFADWKKRNPGR